MPSVTASPGQGSSANVIAPPTRPPSSGAIGPRRSLKRPASGETIASSAALISQIAPIAAVAAPSSSSRSGPSTRQRPEQQARAP